VKNETKIKQWDRIAWVLSAVVLLLVAMMRRYKLDLGVSLHFLPPVHALLNSGAAICLVMALLRIKKSDIAGHQRWINGALALSITFLLCYVAYHFTTPETRYGGTGMWRTVYFILLISHISLAALSLPLILLTYIRGYWGDLVAHRRLSKVVWPVWFYVAVTGPLCYWMLRPYY
jgi:putative membrane protein